MALSETVRDLKYKILEKLTCFGLEHIQLMCAGKQLYNEEKSLFEFRVKDDAEVMVMENEFGGEFDIQSDMMRRHRDKCEQIKAMFSEEDDKLISYILLLKGESVESTITAFITEEKEEFKNELAELESIKSNSQPIFRPPGSTQTAPVQNEGKRQQAFIDCVSDFDAIYEVLFQAACLENDMIKSLTWNLINFLPTGRKLADKIDEEFFQEPLGEYEGTSIREQIEHHTDKMASYFQLNAIWNKLSQSIKNRETNKLMEFLMNGNGTLMVNILMTKFTGICEDIYALIDSNILVAQTLQETLKVAKIATMTPLLNILQLLYNLAIGHSAEEGKYLNFGNRLTL